MNNPNFWLSLHFDDKTRQTILTSNSAKQFIELTPFLKSLDRLDIVVYPRKDNLHLSLNFTLSRKISESESSWLKVFSSNFEKFIKKRNSTDVIPTIAADSQLRFQIHNKGIIFDLSPFPKILLELYLYQFHSDFTFRFQDHIALGTLSQLLQCYTHARDFYNRAYQSIKYGFDVKINQLMQQVETANDPRRKERLNQEVSSLLEKQKSSLLSVMDLSLQVMVLDGNLVEVKRSLKLAGKNAVTMYPNTMRLLKQMNEIK
jgi:hypothetical protein